MYISFHSIILQSSEKQASGLRLALYRICEIKIVFAIRWTVVFFQKSLFYHNLSSHRTTKISFWNTYRLPRYKAEFWFTNWNLNHRFSNIKCLLQLEMTVRARYKVNIYSTCFEWNWLESRSEMTMHRLMIQREVNWL